MTWHIWGRNNDELAFEFKDGEKHVFISIEADGGFGYTIKRNGHFEPGKFTLEHAEGVAGEINEALGHS